MTWRRFALFRDFLAGLISARTDTARETWCEPCAFAFVQGERNKRIAPESGNLGFCNYFNTLMGK
jgi:hypothetical protein